MWCWWCWWKLFNTLSNVQCPRDKKGEGCQKTQLANDIKGKQKTRKTRKRKQKLKRPTTKSPPPQVHNPSTPATKTATNPQPTNNQSLISSCFKLLLNKSINSRWYDAETSFFFLSVFFFFSKCCVRFFFFFFLGRFAFSLFFFRFSKHISTSDPCFSLLLTCHLLFLFLFLYFSFSFSLDMFVMVVCLFR